MDRLALHVRFPNASQEPLWARNMRPLRLPDPCPLAQTPMVVAKFRDRPSFATPLIGFGWSPRCWPHVHPAVTLQSEGPIGTQFAMAFMYRVALGSFRLSKLGDRRGTSISIPFLGLSLFLFREKRRYPSCRSKTEESVCREYCQISSSILAWMEHPIAQGLVFFVEAKQEGKHLHPATFCRSEQGQVSRRRTCAQMSLAPRALALNEVPSRVVWNVGATSPGISQVVAGVGDRSGRSMTCESGAALNLSWQLAVTCESRVELYSA